MVLDFGMGCLHLLFCVICGPQWICVTLLGECWLLQSFHNSFLMSYVSAFCEIPINHCPPGLHTVHYRQILNLSSSCFSFKRRWDYRPLYHHVKVVMCFYEMTFSKNNKNLLWRSTVLFKVWLDKGEENDYSSQIYYHKRKYLMAFSDNLGFSFWFLHTVNIILLCWQNAHTLEQLG